jgi:hypothetical protein
LNPWLKFFALSDLGDELGRDRLLGLVVQANLPRISGVVSQYSLSWLGNSTKSRSVLVPASDG